MKNHHKTFYLPSHASNQGSFNIRILADFQNIKYISSDRILLGCVLIRHYQGGENIQIVPHVSEYIDNLWSSGRIHGGGGGG